jgi:hypothetical protein
MTHFHAHFYTHTHSHATRLPAVFMYPHASWCRKWKNMCTSLHEITAHTRQYRMHLQNTRTYTVTDKHAHTFNTSSSCFCMSTRITVIQAHHSMIIFHTHDSARYNHKIHAHTHTHTFARTHTFNTSSSCLCISARITVLSCLLTP